MVDPTGKPPVPPDDNQPGWKPASPLPGEWRELPADKESSRPVNSWFAPEPAAPDTDSSESQPTVSEQRGYTPSQDQLNSFLSGAADTILEAFPQPAEESPADVGEALPLGETEADAFDLESALEQIMSAEQIEPVEAVTDDTQLSIEASTDSLSLEEIQAQLLGGFAPRAEAASADLPTGEALPSGETQAAVGENGGGNEAVPANEALPSGETQAADGSETQVVAGTGQLPSNGEVLEPDSGETQIVGGTQAQPAVAASTEGTSMVEQPEKSVFSRGLSEAEAAFLAEQRAAGNVQEQAGIPATGSEAAASTGSPSAPSVPATGTQSVGATPAVSQSTQPVSASQPIQASRPVQAQAPQKSAQTQKFEQAERKIAVLRQRHQAGYLTQAELQKELRNLMILDDAGKWWMLGLQTNSWYYFDGRDWIPGIPPGYDEPVQGSPVPTETSMQQVVAEPVVEPAPRPRIELDEDNMPLPQRVPMEDPGATMVSASAPYIEPMRRSEAPTMTRGQQPVAEESPDLTVPSPAQPDQTLRSESVMPPADRTSQRAIPIAPAMDGPVVDKPKQTYKIGEYPQPDYSLARGGMNRTKLVIRLGVIGVIGGMLITLCGLMGMIGYYFYVIGEYRDSVSNLREAASKFETTVIYDSEGVELAQFADTQDLNAGAREEVPLQQISPWLLDATISTENETFYTDPGFSVYAIARAAYQNVQAGSTVSGASTITQQLARALVLDQEIAYTRTTERKLIEVIVASEISRQYTKNEILEIYLNEIFYGNFAYGAEAASQTYFGKSAADLNPAEAAFLAGLPQSPATYDPVVNREAALGRMHTVLRLMAEANNTGCIAIQHADETQWAVPNGGSLCISVIDGPDGNPIYYYQTPTMAAPEEMTLMIAQVEIMTFQPPDFDMRHPHFVNYVWQQLEDTYGSQAIYGAGFRVYTTLDERIQAAAEQSVTNTLAGLQARGIDAENASVVVMRPADGAVIAMVGSADYYNDDIDGQVNVAFTGQQPGSSIKPLVYLTALIPDANGRYLTPASIMWDTYSDFNGYVPTNFDNQYHGPQTVRHSLGNSLNVPAVKALNFIGLERFTEAARQYGLRFPLGDPIAAGAGLPTALGAVEVRLFDMVGAYAMLANNGRYVDPYAILYIEDSRGNVIYRANTSPEGRQVVPAEYAYLVTSILSDNNARLPEFQGVTALQLQGGRPVAVKTGTTNDNRDVWTMGYTPQYVVGVWVGNTDNRPMWGVVGSTGAGPIWNEVMEAAHAGQAIQQFTVPPNVVQGTVCTDSGGTSSSCPLGTGTEIFAASAPPPADSAVYQVQAVQVDSFSLRLANSSCTDAVETLNFLIVDDPTAYSWINGTEAGRQWAQTRNIVLPAQAPPTEYCDPNQPRPFVNVTFPQEGQTYFGPIPVRGIISMPEFAGYEVRYGVGTSPTSFGEPVISNTQMPTGEAVLGTFDLSSLQNGQYTLRVLVYNTSGRNVHRDIHITVNNQQSPTGVTPQVATPQPGVIPASTLAPTFTPEVLQDEPAEGQ